MFVCVAHRKKCILRRAHLVSVGLLMRCQITALSKSFVTVVEPTDIRLLPCMGPIVSAKIEVQREFLSTYVSSERLLSCVDKLVPFEFRVIEKLLASALNWSYKVPLSMC